MTAKELFALPPATPRFIEPMILSEVRELPEGQEWAYEAKLDGYRCLAGKNGRVTLWPRRGTLFTARLPEIARACEKLPADTVVDGKVVAIDANGRASFNLLQHHRSNSHLQFYAFDMPVYRGRSLLHLPLETAERCSKRLWMKFITRYCSPGRLTPSRRISSGPPRSYSWRA